MAKEETAAAVVDLNDIVLSVVRLALGELHVREVAVETNLRREALPVRGNSAQLKQVVLNLLFNAADAMCGRPPGSRTVTVTTGLRPDGWRELAVRDQGTGLAPEVAGDPFRAFVTTKPTGLGLGLSICRTIAGAHGGTLAFDAGVEPGARIVLALPPP